MADASKLKGLRRSGLGAPPPPDEARTDLEPPSIPDPMPTFARVERPAMNVATMTQTPPGMLPEQQGRLDGRTMRRSGRTVQFATRVSPEFDNRLRQIAVLDGILLVEVLERALDAYESTRKSYSPKNT